MAYYGKVNWIEERINATVYTADNPTDTSKWAGKVKYKSSQKADGKYYKYSETVLQSGDTYGATPICKKTVSRMYGAKYKEGKVYYQNYRERITITIDGFLSGLKDDVFSGSLSKDSKKWFFAGYEHQAAGLGTIPQPHAMTYQYDDIDTEVVNKETQISSYARNTSGYIKRNRIRTNVINIELTWSYLTATEAANILKAFTNSQYVKIEYVDALTNTSKSVVCFNSSRNITATYRGAYKDLSITLIQV